MTTLTAIIMTDITREPVIVAGVEELRRFADDAATISDLTNREIARRAGWDHPSTPSRLLNGTWSGQYARPADGLVRILKSLGYQVEPAWRITPRKPVVDENAYATYLAQEIDDTTD